MPCADPVEAGFLRAIDGDTFEATVEPEGEAAVVRLTGVNAPELNGDGGGADCLAEEARDWLVARLTGRDLWLCSDVEPEDRFGRTLAYAYTQDLPSLSVNLELVQLGYACSFPVAPNLLYEEHFSEAETDARADGAGVWGLCPSGCGVP